jgi:hypothetical protein
MFRILEPGEDGSRGIGRRELLRVGGLSALGLSLPDLLGPRRLSAAIPTSSPLPLSSTFGRAKNVIFLWLQGGPPQHETFDPKPDAPAEIRGPFAPIATNVPGVDFSELLPRTARIADKLAVVRSISTDNNLHDASGYWILTGYKYVGTESRNISPTDWPYLGSIVKMLKPSERIPALSSVWLPDVMRLNDNVQPAGQTAGFLGKRWDPDRFLGDPADPNYKVEGLALPDDVPPLRLDGRRNLLGQVDAHIRRLERNGPLDLYDSQAQQAYGLLTSGAARSAFDLKQEPAKILEEYGPGSWSRCLILARRLVEAGARLVHVNWPREKGDTAVTNPLWDTHSQNAERLQNVLCPQFDVGFSALVNDLDRRGLLDETLVVAIGEFGRTPKFNKDGGRDHWGHVFSFAMAGAGIASAQAYGSSDKNGAYPHTNRMEPQDLTATIFHLLGIDHGSTFIDPGGRPLRVTQGTPIIPILGDSPATHERREAGGSLAMVPVYNEDLLLDTDFTRATAIQPVSPGRRIQGWQGASAGSLAVWLGHGEARIGLRAGASMLGAGLPTPPLAACPRTTPPLAYLAQELRNPRAGRFTFSAWIDGGGASAEAWNAFLEHYRCRLVIFGYSNLGKDPTPGKTIEFASAQFRPSFRPIDQHFSVSVRLRSQDDGAQELSKGVGVAVVVEPVAGSAPFSPTEAFLRIHRVEIAFDPRPRNEDVVV